MGDGEINWSSGAFLQLEEMYFITLPHPHP